MLAWCPLSSLVSLAVIFNLNHKGLRLFRIIPLLQLIAALSSCMEGIFLALLESFPDIAAHPTLANKTTLHVFAEFSTYLMELITSYTFIMVFIFRLQIFTSGSKYGKYLYYLFFIPVTMYVIVPIYGIMLLFEVNGFNPRTYWIIYGTGSIVLATTLFILHILLLIFIKKFMFEVRTVVTDVKIPLWMQILPFLTSTVYLITSCNIVIQSGSSIRQESSSDSFDSLVWSLDQLLFAIVSEAIAKLVSTNVIRPACAGIKDEEKLSELQ
jgi:hypothetical protein